MKIAFVIVLPLDFIYLLKPIIRKIWLLIRKSESVVFVVNTTFWAHFHVRVALFKHNFLRDPCTEFWTSWAQMKAENLRNPTMSLHVPTAASKLVLWASKRNRTNLFNRGCNYGHCLKTFKKGFIHVLLSLVDWQSHRPMVCRCTPEKNRGGPQPTAQS